MVSDPAWHALGLQVGKDGWISEDPELIDRLITGVFSRSDSAAFWLSRDLRSPKIWAIWGGAVLALGLGVLWRDPVALVAGLLVCGFYVRSVGSMISLWSSGRLQRGIVRTLEPHPLSGFASAVLEGDPTRVVMKRETAQLAREKLGNFEVLFFEEKKPNSFALELAFRSVR